MENFSTFVQGIETKLRRKLDKKELEFLKWVYRQHNQENHTEHFIHNM